ncbi:photosystem II reaction center PsbP family protein [Wolffia australiana]
MRHRNRHRVNSRKLSRSHVEEANSRRGMTGVCPCSVVAAASFPSPILLPLLPGRRAPASLPVIASTRRSFSLFLSSSLVLVISPTIVAAEVEDDLLSYADEKEGFVLRRPSSWAKVDKAGATALFVSEKNKSNSIGVVVYPVRLSSLKDFGTPEFVAEKLIQAERRKESTKDAQMLTFAERVAARDLPVYEFEYTVDSSRGGPKRIFSAVFVDARKLYILNITVSDKPESPLSIDERTMLEKVLRSFHGLE